ncbi:ABC transporter [Cordyceps militaris]|uniref:ABC transporter n=1 Tax=Cordyceps militaris TaxID=73501 RepID=A0A2H4SMF2_CORMI|nr:ABC transporter [Cordyceps militaris]
MGNTTESPNNMEFTADQLPQDPFLPGVDFQGPVFLDTEACLCALRPAQLGQSKKAVAWQCVGEQSRAYSTLDGKWFPTRANSTVNVTALFSDATSPPDTDKPMFYDGNASLVDLKDAETLGVYNAACTGKNNTRFSQSIYETNVQLAEKKYPTSGVPCFQPGAIPLKIQYADSWLKNGCSEGFLCENNTLNSLPVFCPPVKECLEGRLAGSICKLDGKNIPMGYFEPIVCQEGWYCPPDKHGKETLPCPAGHYCQPGAATPTPCAMGSMCPEGSRKETYYIPLALMIILDLLLVLGVLLVRFRSRLHASSRARGVAFLDRTRGGSSALQAAMGKYERLGGDNENEAGQREMTPLGSPSVPGRDGFSGFQAVFAMPARAGAAACQPANAVELNPQLKAFVDSMRRATDAQDFGLSFGYNGLSFHPKGSPRPILQNVTGSIDVGSLVAVMGGSGAGKSTFVNVLMGKTTHTGGMVTINGLPSKVSRYKKLIGYVPQDDIVLPELTVFENILHAARIRLPRSWKDHDIRSHVECVIDCLELSHVQDSRVGSIGKPILSGGQRKRVSIGMELAAAPMAIFLDEPTSGLDSTAASSIMGTLKALARLGISVITIIHQPRVEIFELLDNLVLLANGQIIYEGTQAGASQYFESMGFHFPPHSNHADVITDIITGNGRDYNKGGSVSKDALIAQWARHMATLPEHQRNSKMSSVYNKKSIRQVLVQRGAPRWKQMWLCLSRAMTQQYRMKGAFIAEMGLAGLAGLLLGLAMNSRNGVLFRGLYNSPFEQLSVATDFVSAPQLALLIAIAIGLVSGAPGVKTFSEELQLHKREAEAGHSRIAYFIAKNLCVLPRMFLGCLHFTTPLMLLATPIIPWGIAFLANVFYFYCIYGLASCISMVVRREDAPLLATMMSLIVGILSGSAPPLSSAKKWHMEWLWRASPGTWLAELYFAQLVEPLRYLYSVDLASKATGFHLSFLWRNMAILVGIGTVYRVVAYVGLVFGHRLRR